VRRRRLVFSLPRPRRLFVFLFFLVVAECLSGEAQPEGQTTLNNRVVGFFRPLPSPLVFLLIMTDRDWLEAELNGSM
jgi:hypothetical protein